RRHTRLSRDWSSDVCSSDLVPRSGLWLGRSSKKEVVMARVNEEVELTPGNVDKYRRHPNGRGWVSPSALVPASTFVSEMAYVERSEERRVGKGGRARGGRGR